MSKLTIKICNVPQCNSKRDKGVTLHKIPQEVLVNNKQLNKWMDVLRMDKLPKYFQICSLHFEKKYLLIPLNAARKRTRLSKAAIPTLNLPPADRRTTKSRSKSIDKDNCLELRNEKKEYIISTEIERMDEDIYYSDSAQEKTMVSVSVQTDIIESKHVECQVQNYITTNWDNDFKLFTKTGISSIRILDVMVERCKILNDESSLMSTRDKILLTMHKLKTNCSFAEIAIDFIIKRQSAKNYFSKTIELLAKAMKGFIYWQSKEQNKKDLPSYFRIFPNVMAVLDCTEIKTIKFSCLSYEETHTAKILIGVSPSGLINYISPMACGKSSDNSIFNLTNLFENLQAGDALIVDEELVIEKIFIQTGVEIIRPTNSSNINTDVINRNKAIASATVHIKKKIFRLKQFKVLSDKISLSLLPYIDNIMIIICAISNLSTSILLDDS